MPACDDPELERSRQIQTIMTGVRSVTAHGLISMSRALSAILFILWTATLSVMAAEVDAKGIEYFEQEIRPLFAEHCWKCHSATAKTANKLKGDLMLDTPGGIRRGGEGGPLVVPGKPAESSLISALRHEGLQMPPDSKLPDAVISKFEHWIKLGAPMPESSNEVIAMQSIDWTEARRAWAFQAPIEHDLPTVKNSDWPVSFVDHFTLAAMESRGLTPNKKASKQDLIRRATFDLIGLPPTPEDVDEFVNDDRPEAFAVLVDRLLKSPHYGERWARYWLDLARYADDEGNSFLSPTPNAYLYRDWVIRAFNQDLPYDEFLRLQLAGDELPLTSNDYLQQWAGLGFQGLGPQFRKGAAGEAKAKADEIEDRVDTLSRGLLGLTVSCARCHDHKFDPIPTRDYYSMAAAYNGAVWSERVLADTDSTNQFRAWEQQLQQQRADLEKWIADQGRNFGRRELDRIDEYLIAAWRIRSLIGQGQLIDEAVAAEKGNLLGSPLNRLVRSFDPLASRGPLDAWILVQDQTESGGKEPDELGLDTQSIKNAVVTALRRLESKADATTNANGVSEPLTEEDKKLLNWLWQDGSSPFYIKNKEVTSLLDAQQKSEYQTRQTKIEQKLSERPEIPAMPSVSGGGDPLHILVRGNPLQPGELAPPGFLRILGGQAEGETANRFTRRQLADAIASSQNPLTARVFVNRVWHYHFGRGIVATLGNFGRQGTPPTHPELLDTLAVRFVKSGWSVKALHREIMLSATYQLSSLFDERNGSVDPDNHYLWRMNPRRLDIEAWRDALLSVSGRLDPKVGGPTLNQRTPAMKERPEDDFFMYLVGNDLDDPNNSRRTIYCIVSRYSPNPTAGLFDFPEPNVVSEIRNVTTIPQQQLFVLNSPLTIAMAKAFAARLKQSFSTERERLNFAWKLAYGRLPTADEIQISQELLNATAQDSAADQFGPWEQLCHSLLCSNEFTFVP